MWDPPQNDLRFMRDSQCKLPLFSAASWLASPRTRVPRWTSENWPMMGTSTPANGAGLEQELFIHRARRWEQTVFRNGVPVRFIVSSPGRKTRQRRDATGTPAQRPGMARGGDSGSASQVAILEPTGSCAPDIGKSWATASDNQASKMKLRLLHQLSNGRLPAGSLRHGNLEWATMSQLVGRHSGQNRHDLHAGVHSSFNARTCVFEYQALLGRCFR